LRRRPGPVAAGRVAIAFARPVPEAVQLAPIVGVALLGAPGADDGVAVQQVEGVVAAEAGAL
jgi:hypothetical protein